MAKQPAKGRKAPPKSAESAPAPQNATESDNAQKLLFDAIPAEILIKPAVEAASAAPSVPVVEKTGDDASADQPDAAAEAAPRDAPTSAPVKPAPEKQRGGFIPLLLGGLIAGGIGYAVAQVNMPQPDTELPAQVAAQADAIAALQDAVDNPPPPIDLSGMEAAQAALSDQIAEMTDQIATLDDRLTALENLPRGEGAASVPALANYEAEIAALREEIAAMAGAAQTQLDTARAEAAAIEENAASAARAAAGRAALSRLQTGMESGAPLGAALVDLEEALGAPAPDALTAAQDGIPTLASLQDTFPEVARAALATARREGVSGEETTGFGAFLRNQFDVRSVTPQEGISADAVLSRAEAAVRTGRLADALAEISALPEVARAEMSEWLAQAEIRADAVAAIDMLFTSLSDS
ncbi:hypothetical protein SLH49_15110 [Cognatiyoonia sp. IB215446]|uniref:COG4223 family protein n=1 Tax=Cognatiyoonia sp. IB215446 TaxID=3097355 RepID=UPI002A10B0FE|nr:hypothetical protein [Cognatiyoonia sp. IB215446]MDX8349314.1 hypothetical protein [Cognatiyoonia sp. IB215446]